MSISALEERAVVAEAVDEHEALRIEIDLVGVRGEVVLRLIVAFAVRRCTFLPLVRNSRIAARDLLQLRDAAAGHAAEVEHQRFDALVRLRGLDGIDEIAHQRFGALLAVRLGDRALERIAGELLDERALRCDHQRGLVRHDRNAGRQRREQRRGTAPAARCRCSTLRSASSARHDERRRMVERRHEAFHEPHQRHDSDAIDRAGGVVGDQHRAVRQHQQIDRATEHFIAAIEAGRERLVARRRASPSSFTRVMR